MPVGDVALIGRDSESALLRAASAEARSGNPAVVLMSGPAGIGKSRLVSALLAEVEDAGALVLSGGCVAIPRLERMQTPYGPFAEALRALPDNQAARDWLEPDAVPESRLDPAQHRRTALLDLLTSLTRFRFVVLALDDLHWADQSSLEMLVFLVRNVRRQRLLIVGASRPLAARSLTATAAAFDHLRQVPRVRWLDLPGLLDTEIAELAQQNGATGDDRIADIVKVAAGHPLAAVELARAPVGQRVPRTIAASVARRMAAADAGTQGLVAAVAVAGGDVRYEELVALLGTTGRSLDEGAARDAVDRDLLEATPGGYRFHHALEHAAVYESLLPGERLALHRAAAKGLASQPTTGSAAAVAERAARIASHWAVTGDVEEVIESSTAAAHASARIAAYPEALAHARRALDGTASTQLTLDAAVYARWAGVPAEGAAIVEQGISRATEPHDQALLWERLGWLRREIGEGDAAAAAYRRAAELVDRIDDPALVSRVRAGHAAFLMTRYRLLEAKDEARSALDLAGSQPSATRANALNTLGVVLAMTGEEEAGLDLLTESRDVALAAHSEEDVWRYVGNATFVLQNLGRTAEALEIAIAARNRAARGGVSRSLAALPVITNAVSASVLLGRWDDAMEMIDDALRGDPPPAHEAHLRLYAATVHQLRARGDDAKREVETARRVGAGTKDPAIDVRADAIDADLAASLQRFDLARELLRRALDHVRHTDDAESVLDLVSLGLRIEADAAHVSQRSTGWSAQLAGDLDDLAEGMKDEARADLRLALDEARAETARSTDDDTSGQWRDLAAGWTSVQQPQRAGYARLREAEAALAARDRAAARRAWLDGCGLVEPLGVSRLQADLDGLARRARLLRTAAGKPADPIGLTPREVEVLRLLVDGLSNRQIARRLGMSEKTASVHVSNLMAKLGVTSRARAAAVATQLGLPG